ncbi:MAG: hypothetical protein ABL907_23200 [Hyphomicrobium sp.]
MRKNNAIAAALVSSLALLISGFGAEANWLTALTKGAGKAATHAHPELGAIGKAAGHLADLPAGSRGALAAHATPEGHWQFANREGQVFTAGTADEMRRVLPALSPGAGGDTQLTLYLSEDSAFANRQALDKLPMDADLHLVTDAGAFPVSRGIGDKISVRIKPNVSIEAADKGLFDESLQVLMRPLNKSNIRTIAVEPGASATVSSAPRLDPVTRAPLVDQLDPVHLTRAFSSIRDQTALMVGRIGDGKIFFQPGKGPEISRELDEVLAAASEADVNLVLLHADAPRQPGGTNWLWQKIEVGGLDTAISKSTFGDFLDALGAKRAPMSVAAEREGLGRVHISATPSETGGPVAAAQHTFDDLIGHVTGEVASQALDVYARDKDREKELDGRLIPGIPTYVQIPYLVALGAGVLGWGTARGWWRRVWPPRVRKEGQGKFGYWFGNVPNFLVFLLLFLPIAGMPALIWQALQNLWASITAPFRWIAKVFRRRVEV